MSAAPLIFYMIKASIDVTKIDKTKLYQGKKGKYLNIILIERQDDFGNSHMVVQDVTKEERLAGAKGAILGNAKTYGQGGAKANKPAADDDLTSAPRKPAAGAVDDDIPF